MRILYLTNARLPTEKAHGLATVKLCEAFADAGAEVTVMHPWRLNPLREDLYAYYGVKRNCAVRTLPSVDLLWLGFGERFFFLVQLFSFSKIAALWLLFRYGLRGELHDTVIFSHDHVPLFFASFFAPRIFYDIHDYPRHTWLYRRVLERAVGIGVQTKWKIEALAKDFGVPTEKIVYWPNGTDIDRFDVPLTREDARTKLSLVQKQKIVLYAGSLRRWKGVETLVAAAGLLPSDVTVYIIGGGKADIENFQFSIFNSQNLITFVGQRPWAEIPLWLKAADVLVLPNTGREEISRHYTSPMKLFEYMASRRPIVCSDIPSIREIVDETMVWFARPDDPRSLADTIQQVLARSDEAAARARRARQEVAKYTWQARAKKILAHLSL